MHGCCNALPPTLSANARARRVDPTRTNALIKRFEADLTKRFKSITDLITKNVGENNFLGLTNDPKTASANKVNFGELATPDKISAFMDWLKEQSDKKILEVSFGTAVVSSGSESWMNIYIQQGYANGVKQGATNLRGAGAKVANKFVEAHLRRKIHADRIGLIYTRAYESLKGVTEVMADKIRNEMAMGIIHGSSQRLAKDLNDRVEKIGLTRAKVIARTEINRAHNEAKVNLFEEAGLEGVQVEAEFQTARDDAVCPECEAIADQQYSISDARGMLPIHPRCRCTWNPVVVGGSGIELR